LPEDCTAIGGMLLSGLPCESCPTIPTVVGISVSAPNGTQQVYRVWSDGQVDFFNHSPPNCSGGNLPCVLVEGSCTTDVDRDGDTGINDFLSLLGNWGPCE
jgi:hypothetical protein